MLTLSIHRGPSCCSYMKKETHQTNSKNTVSRVQTTEWQNVRGQFSEAQCPRAWTCEPNIIYKGFNSLLLTKQLLKSITFISYPLSDQASTNKILEVHSQSSHTQGDYDPDLPSSVHVQNKSIRAVISSTFIHYKSNPGFIYQMKKSFNTKILVQIKIKIETDGPGATWIAWQEEYH